MTIDDSGVRAVESLSRRATLAEPEVIALDSASSLLVSRVRDDEHLQPFDIEAYLEHPRRARGSATVYDAGDFAGYVHRTATSWTTAWADEATKRITAVINDYMDPGADDADAPAAGWRDHRVELAVQPDPDWQAWMARNGKLGDQEGFADFLEEQAHTVVTPDAATMLEIATTFRAAKSGSFSRAIRQVSGDVNMRFTEETTASAGRDSQLDVPERFTIKLAPFLGLEPVEMQARLVYRVREGNLTIGHRLHRPDLVQRAAWQQLRTDVATAVSPVPVYLGPAPAALPAADVAAHARPADTGSAAREVRELRSLLVASSQRR